MIALARAVAVTLVLAQGCAYKVTPLTPERGFQTIGLSGHFEIERIDEGPRGQHCFEPMLYVITAGLVPTHCLRSYRVTTESDDGSLEERDYELTTMQGWLTLFLPPFPSWYFGAAVEGEKLVEAVLREQQRKQASR